MRRGKIKERIVNVLIRQPGHRVAVTQFWLILLTRGLCITNGQCPELSMRYGDARTRTDAYDRAVAIIILSSHGEWDEKNEGEDGEEREERKETALP